MGGEQSRRRFLRAGLAIGVTPGLSRASHGRKRLSKELQISSDGGGVATYEFTVTGALQQVDDDDQVTGNRAWGHVGPKRGTDTFGYSGDIAGIVLTGPATAYRDGSRIHTDWFPHPKGSLTSGDFNPSSGTNVLRIESDGGGFAGYEFAVNGSLRQRDNDDQVIANRAWGNVGPERGADTFEFTGDVTQFELAGPASVFLNGSAVTPSSGTPNRGLLRANPSPDVTATPDSRVLFEAVAPDHANQHIYGDWYVDGQKRVGPGQFFHQLGGRGRVATTQRFDSSGTHDVYAEAYEREESGDRGQRIGSVSWQVRVSSDGNRAPSVTLVRPDIPVAVSRHSPQQRAFEVAVSDPEGALDRAVWWVSQCDAVVAVSNVTGARDTVTLTHEPSVGCPLAVAAIDRNGAVSDFTGWRYEERD